MLIDLLVNIFDHLLLKYERCLTGAFLIQDLAIACALISLMVHFLNISDQVRISSRAHFLDVYLNSKEDGAKLLDLNKLNQHLALIPQRIALKLVLDKYWWSMFVGFLYSVLTLISQISKLDSLEYEHGYQHRQTTVMEPFRDGSVLKENLTTINNNSELIKLADSFKLAPNTLAFKEFSTETKLDTNKDPGDLVISTSTSTYSILLLLLHRIVSTCYYVSFLVMYRISPNHIVNRLFKNTNKSPLRIG